MLDEEEEEQEAKETILTKSRPNIDEELLEGYEVVDWLEKKKSSEEFIADLKTVKVLTVKESKQDDDGAFEEQEFQIPMQSKSGANL